MNDFWPACGYRFLQQKDGALIVTDDFLRSLYLRPEVAPIADSCDAELKLHDALMKAPRRDVASAELLTFKDADAQANYRVLLRFRDRLLAATTLEAAYLNLFKGDGVDVPPLFVFQLTQIFLRHVLGANTAADPLEARMGECLFRVQKISVLEDGAVMAADDEAIETYAETGGFGSLGELLKKQNTPTRSIDLDVLAADNKDAYWPRDERFDFAVSLNRGQPALDALMRVLEKWVKHFLGVEVEIKHRREIDDKHWVWHVGLDATASGVLNDLYNQSPVDEERMNRLLCLFELRFKNPTDMRQAIAGKPIYLAMAMDTENKLKLKPQNLLLNLPLNRA
ncbi:MAG: hypothetical protein EAZ24_01415 [Burkholderiales bacterium]|nr:MAG: hypothetical protein EAZ21_14515 [Betaproteobacteria bacterium]TAG84397.1 MAG: hypothetical protein EAZ24_01415 [Burkholderiales bacterium]